MDLWLAKFGLLVRECQRVAAPIGAGCLREGWLVTMNAGVRAFGLEDNKAVILLALFLGVVFHWIYEVAIAATKDGTWDFGNTGQILARIVISLVVSIAGLIAAYSQVQKVDRGFRLVSAFVAGLSVDALTAPWLQANA